MPAKALELIDASQTKLSDLISAAMDEKNLSIRGLAEKLDMTYEHVRRIVRGEGVPSTTVLRAICQELGLDYGILKRQAVAAKIQAKYGDIPIELSGKNPELQPLERIWEDLTTTQKQDIITMAQGWAKRNRALGA